MVTWTFLTTICGSRITIELRLAFHLDTYLIEILFDTVHEPFIK